MRTVEIIPGMGERKIKNGGGGEFKYMYLIHCKNFCGCHSVPPLNTVIKNKVFIEKILVNNLLSIA
jgi:hypothetical protein